MEAILIQRYNVNVIAECVEPISYETGCESVLPCTEPRRKITSEQNRHLASLTAIADRLSGSIVHHIIVIIAIDICIIHVLSHQRSGSRNDMRDVINHVRIMVNVIKMFIRRNN